MDEKEKEILNRIVQMQKRNSNEVQETFVMVTAIAKLLIEKGIITQKDYDTKFTVTELIRKQIIKERIDKNV